MIVLIKCIDCGKEYKFNITEEQYHKYCNGEDYVQNIFPELSPELREMFISRICPKCWDKMFKEEEE